MSFSVNGNDRSKWWAMTNLDRQLRILGFYDDEEDAVDDVDDAFLLVVGDVAPEFVIDLRTWKCGANH